MPPGMETSGFFAKIIFGYLAEATPYAHAKSVADFYYHGKNACNIVFSGEAFGQHIKPVSADTHREQQLMQRYPVVHSCSKDKYWLIREDVAHITLIFLLSNPEDNWGSWKAKPSRSITDAYRFIRNPLSISPTEVSQTNACCCLHETDCISDSESKWLCSADMTLQLCKWLCSAYMRQLSVLKIYNRTSHEANCGRSCSIDNITKNPRERHCASSSDHKQSRDAFSSELSTQ